MPYESSRCFNWRRLFQFRLRTLLILTTIIAVVLGWWSYKARQQREAVEALIGKDGIVRYDFRLPWTGKMNNQPQWPKWLRDKVGVDYFGSVNGINLNNTKVTDASLEHLKCLTTLQGLSLDGTQITDAGLEHLKGITTLQELWLGGTQVTDAGLEHLQGLTAMQVIRLDGTQVTDAGVARLQKALPNCKIYR